MIGFTLFIIFILFVLRWSLSGSKEESSWKQAVEKTRRVEVVNDKRYSVITVERTIISNKKNGRLAIICGTGWQRDPYQHGGKIISAPKWIQAQYINKKTNTANGAYFWTSFQNWDILRYEEINEYTELKR